MTTFQAGSNSTVSDGSFSVASDLEIPGLPTSSSADRSDEKVVWDTLSVFGYFCHLCQSPLGLLGMIFASLLAFFRLQYALAMCHIVSHVFLQGSIPLKKLKVKHQSSCSVESLYQDWMLSRRVVELLQNQQPESVVEEALENTLMLASLSSVGVSSTFSALIENLDQELLQRGFESAGCFVSLKESKDMVSAIRSEVKRGLKTGFLSTHPTLEENWIRYGSYQLGRTRRVEEMLGLVKKSLGPKEAVRSVLASGMMYESFCGRKRQGGLKKRVYEQLYHWGVRNEGFASPFNSMLFDRDDCRFFSAFEQVDHVFGGKGSVFAASCEDHAGGWCFHPPYLREFLERVDQLIGRWKASGSSPMILVGPAWYALKTIPDETITFPAGSCLFEDVGGQTYPCTTDTRIWRFGKFSGFDASKLIALF